MFLKDLRIFDPWNCFLVTRFSVTSLLCLVTPMCTATCMLKSLYLLCLKRTKATLTAAQATRKSLKKIGRRINVLTVTLFLQDSLQAFSSLQVALAILVEQLLC